VLQTTILATRDDWSIARFELLANFLRRQKDGSSTMSALSQPAMPIRHATEIHVCVKSVVDLLLNGAVAAYRSALKPTPRRRCIDASRSDIHGHPEGCLEEARYG
jgi:hypothetical protein